MAGQNREVLIEYPDGTQYSCATPAIAKQAHPEARIVRYFDGRPYEEEKKPAATGRKRSTAARPSRRKQATPAELVIPDSVPAAATPDPATSAAESSNGAPDEA